MTLEEFFRQQPEAAVAFSGGVDSALLLYEAARLARRTAAYFVRTPFQPAFELADAEETAERVGAALRVIEFDVLTVPAVAANPADRCYHCKRALFSLLLQAARADGFSLVLDGSNASDDASDRPGMRALAELRVRSPLRECDLDKGEIRRRARQAGLPVWDKPSYACLATRIPTGTAITAPDLARVERGEAALMDMGFTDFRLRLRGEAALLQVPGGQLEQARAGLEDIRRRLSADFCQVQLDSVPRPTRET